MLYFKVYGGQYLHDYDPETNRGVDRTESISGDLIYKPFFSTASSAEAGEAGDSESSL